MCIHNIYIYICIHIYYDYIYIYIYIYISEACRRPRASDPRARPHAGTSRPGSRRSRAPREFKGVVFEDVVFDNNSLNILFTMIVQ